MVLLSRTQSTEGRIISALAFLLFILTTAGAAAPVALPGCPETCGNITVPYPFGTRPGCFREGFNLTCDETPGRPPRLFVGDGVEVVGISLADGTVRIHSKMLGVSLSANATSLPVNASWSAGLMATGRLAVSTRHNRFVAMGCNLLASLVVGHGVYGSATSYVSVCAALCADNELSDTSCSGVGCCQTPIAFGLPSYRVQLRELAAPSPAAGTTTSLFGAMFIADQEWFSRKGTILQLDYFGEEQRIVDTEVIPTVLEWSLDMNRDQDMFRGLDSPGSGRCISLNSIVIDDGVDGSNFGRARSRCNCSKGFEGNPYFANGCQAFRRKMVLFSSAQSTEAKITVLAFQLFVLATAGAAPPVALPGCPETCGNITVPYPFGTRPGCFREGFNLTCEGTPGRPPKLLLGDGVEVIDISLPDGTVRIHSKMMGVSLLANGTFSLRLNASWSAGLMTKGHLAVSTRHNRFVAMGCNLIASLVDPGAADFDIVSVCATLCAADGSPPVSDTSCAGVGCCQTPIALGLPSYRVHLRELTAPSPAAGTTSLFGALFIADQEWFSREGPILQLDYFGEGQRIIDTEVIPTVLEWSLDMNRDQDMFRGLDGPDSSGCISLNSIVVHDGVDGSDFGRARCNCSKGFEGNPYFANGCQDIDECQQPDLYPCHGTCINLPGTYRCSSKKSISSLPGLITIIAISAGFGLLFSVLGVARIINMFKQRRVKKLRQKFFKRNHGLLLQQLISSNKDIAERMKIFSLEELDQATNNFDQNRILGGGGHGTVYKGILSDQHVVAIKKSKIVVQREIDQFVNEVVILSQTNHRNVVKLFGCCLETEVPLLVYEFISNGTLSYHLHEQSDNPLSWKDRLRIALETARAIAYLHRAASISVFHRDIKSANILLTDTLTAKVSDFGASRSISIDETGVHTAIQGTHGYLDPEYYYTSRLTEKSDVYSFGVILAELLTRITPIFSSQSSSESISLASYFMSLIRDNRLSDILDLQIVEEGGTADAEVVARLAAACLCLKGVDRPTMRQVETTLEDLQSSKVHQNFQITTVSQNVTKDQSYNGSKGSEGTRLYSLEKEFIQSSEIPR
ncbi:unnamed protein product [Urochloa humidicola]